MEKFVISGEKKYLTKIFFKMRQRRLGDLRKNVEFQLRIV